MSSFATMMTSDHEVVASIAEIADRRRPEEACGVILPQCYVHTPLCNPVHELDNIIPDPSRRQAEFELNIADLLGVVWAWRRAHEDPDLPNTDYLPSPHGGFSARIIAQLSVDVVLWHSHPSGLIGPSRGDVRNKIAGLKSVVVTTFTAAKPVVSFY